MHAAEAECEMSRTTSFFTTTTIVGLIDYLPAGPDHDVNNELGSVGRLHDACNPPPFPPLLPPLASEDDHLHHIFLTSSPNL